VRRNRGVACASLRRATFVRGRPGRPRAERRALWRSRLLSGGRLTVRLNTANCWRSARFAHAPRRSGTVIASNSGLSNSTSACPRAASRADAAPFPELAASSPAVQTRMKTDQHRLLAPEPRRPRRRQAVIPAPPRAPVVLLRDQLRGGIARQRLRCEELRDRHSECWGGREAVSTSRSAAVALRAEPNSGPFLGNGGRRR
jgi:hypothetical protein